MAAEIGYDRNHQEGGAAVKKEKKKYFAWGLTAFLTGCALLIFYDVF